MEPNRGASPDSAQVAEQPVNPVPAQADTSSSKAQDSDFSTRAASANSPAAIRELINDAVTGKVSDKPKTPDVVPTADKLPPDLAAAAANEPAETTPETTEETPAETTPEGTPAANPDDDEAADAGDGPITPIRSNRPRVQLPTSDEVGRLTISYQKRNRDWTLEQAMAEAKKQLGISTPKANAADTPAPTPESTLPKTVDEVNASIKQLRAQRRQANIDLKFEESSDISDKLEDLIEHKANLERQAERSQNEALQAYDRAFEASDKRARELYEFLAQPDSAGAKRMLEIEADLKALNDPLYHDPEKPLRIAQMAARELNIAPRRKGAVPPVKAPVTPVVAPKPKSVLPGGESRTTPITAPQKPAIDAKIEGVKTLGDLREVYKQLGVQI